MPVCLPHDAMLLEPRDAKCRNGVNSGYFPGGKYTYEKHFQISSEDLGQFIAVCFDGVYQNCTVSVNAKRVGTHFYGFTLFEVDISQAVHVGENVIRVFVDNSLEPNCRWYTGSGIYRPVQLVTAPKVRIQSVHIDTLNYDPAEVAVTVQTTEPLPVTVEIYDGETLVASGAPGKFCIADAKLWSAENPYLYTCVVKIATEARRCTFGIRKLSWSAKTGFLVNGQRVLLRGGCLHHDHGVLGACEFWDAQERRLRILKENGFNAVRISHNPASQITLDLCDRLGLYVMNEAFDSWYIPKTYHDYARRFDTDWQSDLTALVESSRNHPSVLLYSVGNEVSRPLRKKAWKRATACAISYMRSIPRGRSRQVLMCFSMCIPAWASAFTATKRITAPNRFRKKAVTAKKDRLSLF